MIQLCVCRGMKHLGSLWRTQESRVAQLRLEQLLCLFRALRTSRRASYLGKRTAET